MATIEELEQRVTKVEMFIFEIVREKFSDIDKRLASLYEKTERDKTELIKKIEGVRAEMIERIEGVKTEMIGKIEMAKTSLVKWMVGLFVAFSILLITAIWAILNFAVR